MVKLMDQIFEEILRALERNDFKESQRRIALIKFIGECYNFKVVHTDTLFDLLYRLINLSPPSTNPSPDASPEDLYMKAFDSPSDSFRIRLICTLLDSLGRYFHRGPRKQSMDRFLVFFQRYIYSKSYVLMDLEFMILDTFDQLRPALLRFQSHEEADEVCRLIEDRETKGKEVGDILGSYQRDGGGYDYYY